MFRPSIRRMFRGPWALCVKRADTSRCHLQRTTTGHPRDDSSIPQLLESPPSKAKPSLARFYACSFANSLASPLLWLESRPAARTRRSRSPSQKTTANFSRMNFANIRRGRTCSILSKPSPQPSSKTPLQSRSRMGPKRLWVELRRISVDIQSCSKAGPVSVQLA